ncbi:MAG: phosphate uptake regulator PhoU [Euryarchaeota archaeon]|nr:phosphate uptake regulator PhoU [Euryarchaeota archaeon]
MSMDVRKIQKTGLSTMTVSLPKEWIVERGLKPGDPVTVQMMGDGTLTINPRIEKRGEAVRKTIALGEDESSEHLTRKLIGAYLAGFNIIEIRSRERFSLDLKRAVKDFSRMVIGPEVIEETSDSIVLHDLSDPIELSQQKCVRRMHLIVRSMHSDAIAAFEKGEEELAKDVIDRDAEVDRLYWMVIKQYNLILKNRQLADKMGIDVYDGMSLMLVARVVERIGDHAEKIARNALLTTNSKTQTSRDDGIGRSSASALTVLDVAVEAMFAKDIEAANEAIDKGSRLVEACEKARGDIKSPNGLQAITRSTVLDSIARTTMYAMDIAEIAINGAMRKAD